MRDIKFRAWIMHDKWMREFDLDDVYGGEFDNGQHLPSSEYIMQFTGLQDKNRVDIYEGDIYYIAGYGHYVCEFPFIELYEAAMEGDIGPRQGNIHQNPELIKRGES